MDRICELYEGEVEYAVGTIESYRTSPFRVVYKYSFSANRAANTGKEKAYGIGQLDERVIGKQFVVIYQKGDPSNSDLNTDYLIETNQDFEDFKTEFSSAPPSPDVPDNCK
jgi:hypothetical protein